MIHGQQNIKNIKLLVAQETITDITNYLLSNVGIIRCTGLVCNTATSALGHVQ
jgi:hypothetical protein